MKTNSILDFICSNSSRILELQNSTPVLYSTPVKVASTDTEKIAEAIDVINQQRDLIRGLQLAQLEAVKIAAALTEACKLAQDGAIDVTDVVDNAHKLLVSNSVKLSSIEEFNASPGEIVAGNESTPQDVDVLTQTLRELH